MVEKIEKLRLTEKPKHKQVREQLKKEVEETKKNASLLDWFKNFFGRVKDKGLKAALVGSLVGLIRMILKKKVAPPETLKKPRDKFLACESFKECREILRQKHYVLDSATGNYINPKRLSGIRLLNEPIVEKTIGNKKVKLKRSVMARLARADEKYFAATGKHIKIISSGRTNEKQFDLYKRLKPKGMVVATPGDSFHEICQAIDCGNWEEAEPYLLAEGFAGGTKGIANDPGHFSVGEMRYKSDPLLASRHQHRKKAA